MAVSYGIEDNEVLGPPYREGKAEGRREGKAEGIAEGVRGLAQQWIEDRFGPLPSWATERLAQSTPEEIAGLGRRIFDARSIEELFQVSSAR